MINNNIKKRKKLNLVHFTLKYQGKNREGLFLGQAIQIKVQKHY